MAACINTFSQKGDVLDNTVWSTLEDPIEYRFDSTDSFKITQKEMGEDFREFAWGALNSLNGATEIVILLARKGVTGDSKYFEDNCLTKYRLHLKKL